MRPMLPLAISSSLLMLLSSLSFQALALQQRGQLQLLFRQRQLEDQLQSAAQRLVGRLQRQHRCLLPLPLEQWSAAHCAPLPAAMLVPDGMQLLDYQPVAGGARLLLRRTSGGAAGAFALQWQTTPEWDPPALHQLQFLGLRGVTP